MSSSSAGSGGDRGIVRCFVKTTESAAVPERLLYPHDEARDKLGGIRCSTLYWLVECGDLEKVKIDGRSSIIA